MVMAIAAMTFAACEDVPAPYDIPEKEGDAPIEIEDAKGTGTKDDPYNTAAALNVGNKLSSGEETTDYCYIKGKVVSIMEQYSTQFGNARFYISSDGTATNQFYVYRALYLGNKKFVGTDTEIKVGDEVVICAIITNYNGTIETAQNKGFLYSLNGENRGGEPQESKPGADPTGEGTQASPYNVAAVLKYIATLGSDKESPNQVYVKGKVSQIKEEFTSKYGNGTFYISDDGEQGNEFYAFQILYLGNKKFVDGDVQVKQGDEVIICGNVINYKGNTPETVKNKSYLYSLNGKTEGSNNDPQPDEEAKGDGSLENPFNSVAANAEAAKLADKATSDKSYYIKGKVVAIATDKNGNAQNYDYGTYGNASFYISDDGQEAGQFYVYRALYLGNKKWEQGAGDVLKPGDEVIVYGKLYNYGGTYETAQNEAYLYSLNGNTEGGNENPEPQPGGDDYGTEGSPISVASALAIINGLADGATTDTEAFVIGKITSVTEISTSYGNATYIIGDEGAGNALTVFRGYSVNGEKFTFESELKAGDEVVVKGKLQKYVNKNGEVTPEIATGSSIVRLNGTGDKPDNPQPGGDDTDGYGTLSGNVLTLIAKDLGVENGKEPGVVKLVDGTTLTFDGGGNTNPPKYYNSGESIRMYPKNSMTVKANGKTIQAIQLSCTEQSGTLCNADGKISASPGSVATSGNDVNVSGINSASTTITNTNGETGAASQLRFDKLVITYAE